jgi:Zn-dependent protease
MNAGPDAPTQKSGGNAGGQNNRRYDEGGGIFHRSVSFGRVQGIVIGANWSWFVVFGLIVWSLAAVVFPDSRPGLGDGAYIAMAFVGSVLFFTSLVLHELGHAIVAKREGMEIAGITLWVFGGVAQFRGMFPSAAAEFRIAVAGPLVSALIGGFCLALAEFAGLPTTADAVVEWLGMINLVLVAFNMLPALPLDGGRVLRSLLWMSMRDFTRATRYAGALGRTIGQLMIIGGVAMLLFGGYAGGLWIGLIGWFVMIAATAELSLATIRGAFEGLTVGDATVQDPACIASDLTLRRFVDESFPLSRHAAYPVIAGGRVVGLLPFSHVTRVASARWPEMTVADVMIPLEQAPLFEAGDELADAAMELSSGLGRALVTSEGAVTGMISITDVSRMLELRRLGA